jgi:hypothetical protein
VCVYVCVCVRHKLSTYVWTPSYIFYVCVCGHPFLSPGQDNALNVLETDFIKSLDDHVTQVLWKRKSIPLFLATITMDLFDKQTMAL